jgi:hypothetical protein
MTTDTAPARPVANRGRVITRSTTSTIRRSLVATGLVGIAAIHLADLPSKMSEVPYLGFAYIGLIAASLVLAELVTRSADRRLMTASAGLAAAVIVGFVINRTVGMPNAMDDVGNWSEPLGMISLLIEGVVLWVAAHASVAHR